MASYVIRNADQRDRLASWFSRLNLDKPKKVVIEDYKRNRSQEQNSRMWALLTECANHCRDEQGRQLSKESWHFKLRCDFGYIDGTFTTHLDGVPVECPSPKSSTKMNVSDMSDYQTQIEAYMAEQGVIPEAA